MMKPPRSRISIALYVVAAIIACGCAVALYQFMQLPGDTRAGTLAKMNALRVARQNGLTALCIFAFGYGLQMIADIRWKLFEGSTDA
jgi:hypothetical protein